MDYFENFERNSNLDFYFFLCVTMCGLVFVQLSIIRDVIVSRFVEYEVLPMLFFLLFPWVIMLFPRQLVAFSGNFGGKGRNGTRMEWEY